MKHLFRLLIVLMALAVSPVIRADNTEALMTLLKALAENGTISQDVYQMVEQVAASDSETKTEQVNKEEVQKLVKEEVKEATKDQPKITMKDKFEVQSNDGDFTFRVGGRIQADAAIYDEDVRNQNDGTEMRRARLFAQGTLWKAWNYKLQYDFTSTGSDGIADAYIQYQPETPWNITVGHFKEPFSLQNMTSSKYITFTERGLPHLFTPGRALGIGAGTGGDNWSFNAGVFGEGIDGASGDEDEGFSITGRGTYAPILDENQHLHLGASLSYRDTGSVDTISFSDRPESHVTNVKEVSTGSINTESNIRAVLESAYTYKQLSLQGEYYYVDIDGLGASNLNFDGYYIEGSWFLTDDMRSYKGSDGAYGKIKPRSAFGKGGIGAWQIAVRFSSVDLTDENVVGGEADNLSVGLNWFPNSNLRFSANYVNVLDVEGGAGDGDEPEAFQVRAQVEF